MGRKKQLPANVKKLAIRAFKKGLNQKQIAELYEVDRTTIARWVKRDKEKQLNRKEGTGRPPKIDSEKVSWILELTMDDATKYGFETDLWTSSRILKVFTKEFKIKVSIDTIQRLLTKSGFSYHKPERRYYEDEELKEKKSEWFKNERVKMLKFARKNNAVMYFEDEANVSLSPILGKTWAKKGTTPIVNVTKNRGSISAISAISSGGNLLFKLYDKKITSIEIILFLKQILLHHKGRNVVVTMDNASSHKSKKVKEFIESQKRLTIFYFSPYSPEFNPDEKVWNHLKNEELKSHQAKTKAELQKLTQRKLANMAKDKKLVRGIFNRCSVANYLR